MRITSCMHPAIQWTALVWMAALCSVVQAAGSPQASRVSPQRLTVFVGRGEYRVVVEGRGLDEVDRIVAVDTSRTGYMIEVSEIETRIAHKTDGRMEMILRAVAAPESPDRLQLQLVYGHQKYLIPAGLFQFDVR